jgi:DNA modification methylase
MRDLILFGDCKQNLSTFLPKTARTCVTSPPYYGLRNYGDEDRQIGQENTPEEYIQNLVEVFREVREVLTDDGTLWLNMGDSYYNYRPGKGQALVKQSVSNTKQDLPDKCAKRANKLQGLKEKDLIGIPWMLAFALRADGWYLRQDIIWHKPNPMPESVRDRCTKAHEYIFLLSKNKHYYYDNDAIKEPAKDWGTRDRTKGKYHNKGTGLQPHTGLTKSYPTKNKRSVWSITKRPYKGAHFATYPPELIEPCIKAGSQEGDCVLDPFMGSGTTAAVAKSLGRDYIGCELHEDYGNLIQQRVEEYEPVPEVAQESTVNILDLI